MDATEWESKEIEYQAKIDTLSADLSASQQSGEEKDKEIAKLQAYIAKYVCSDKPAKAVDESPKSFKDMYRETIQAMNSLE